jgi:hypothetical protein
MSISNIIDPATKKIYPSLLNGQGGAVDSVSVKEGLVNVGTAVDPIIGLDVSLLGELLVCNGTANEAEALQLGALNQILSVVNTPAGNVPAWVNGSSGGFQDGFGLYLSLQLSMGNLNTDAPDNGPHIIFTTQPAPLTSGICSSLVIDSGGGGNPVGLRWTGTNPVAIFLQADLLCQSKTHATGAPINFLDSGIPDYNFASAGIQMAIKETGGGYITPICRYIIGGAQSIGNGTYESTMAYQGIMNPTDTVEFTAITNWIFNKTGSQAVGALDFLITLGAVNVYVVECAYPA